MLPLVFEVQHASYGAFTRKLHDEIGRSLSSSSQVRAVWLAAEDTGTPAEQHYLQMALDASDAESDDMVATLIRFLERAHRVKIAISRCKSDVVPREVKEWLGLDNKWDASHVSLAPTDWSRVR